MRPVDLRLFARQGDQTQVRLGCWPWPVVADQITKVAGPARIAAFLDHDVETAGRQTGEFLQGLTDER